LFDKIPFALICIFAAANYFNYFILIRGFCICTNKTTKSPVLVFTKSSRYMLLPPNLNGTKECTTGSHGQTNVKVAGVRAGHRVENIVSIRTSFHASIVDQPASFVKGCCFFTTEPPPRKLHSKPTQTKIKTKRICFFRGVRCWPIYMSIPQKKYLEESKMYSFYLLYRRCIITNVLNRNRRSTICKLN